jgi:hypothetical protein
MPVYKHNRTGNTVAADQATIDALGADKYEKIADESPDEEALRVRAEAEAAKVDVEDLSNEELLRTEEVTPADQPVTEQHRGE